MTNSKNKWWKSSVVYQIYPQSFNDSNNDGIGDFQGIIAKLPYLKKLGIDVIWLNPIYQSPLVDNGYDISDYYQVNPMYGTLSDFQELLQKAHELGIRILLDLVVNHTSNQHKWFEASKKSKDNEYSDYYIWKDPKPDGSAPNNWGASFGGSAWTYVPERGQYYLHLFAKEQPDLNWENPKVRQSVYKMMRYWFDMGIDGFRMDVITLISKRASYPDGPILPGKPMGSYYAGASNGPRLHEFLKEMNREVLSKYDALTVGEAANTNADQAILITDPDRDELNMVFQFDHMHIDYGKTGKFSDVKFKLSDLRYSFTHWQKKLYHKGWNSLYWDNHDQPRAVSRFGNDGKYRVQSAKMLGTVLHMQQGTPYIYEGEEIGMTNAKFASLDQYKDLDTWNIINNFRKQGLSEDYIKKAVYNKSRDNARTPMQWDNSKNAGFSDGKPWIDMNPNYPDINVKQALEDDDSIFYHYQKLIQLRHQYMVITDGEYKLITHDSAVYGYVREDDYQILVVISSFTDKKVNYHLPDNLKNKDGKLLLSNYESSPKKLPNDLFLEPYESVIYLINKD